MLQKKENFVSQSESLTIVSNTFIGAGLMLFAMVVTWLFIWSYQKDRYLFIAILSFVALIYSSEMVIVSAVSMKSLSDLQFKLIMGSSLLFSFIFILVGLFGFIKYKRRTPGSYVPSNVSDYLN